MATLAIFGKNVEVFFYYLMIRILAKILKGEYVEIVNELAIRSNVCDLLTV